MAVNRAGGTNSAVAERRKILRQYAGQLTDRSIVPTTRGITSTARGLAFSRKDSTAYPGRSPLELAKILLAEAAVPAMEKRRGSSPFAGSAATLFIDTFTSREASDGARKNGLTVVDISDMNDREMRELINFARGLNIGLDYHAPWLAKERDGQYFYPTPTTHPIIFDQLTRLAIAHKNVFGVAPQITFHMSGEAKDWRAWVDAAGTHAVLLVENAFVNRGIPAGTAGLVTSAYDYFLRSGCHTPEDFAAFVHDLGLHRICFDPAHAFVGWVEAKANPRKGRFDPLGDLRFLDAMKRERFHIARMHRTRVARELGGQRRGDTPLSEIDSHGRMTPFLRRWFLVTYPEKIYPGAAKLINRVFDFLRDQQSPRKGRATDITYEIWPSAFSESEPADFETKF